tara:strand:- start:121551 stop:122405 length:855 start_codon:yes stop_codon:yes gene_type:complete
MLMRIPKRWQRWDPDSLTDIQDRTLFLLVAAGMVERRCRLRMQMLNHPVLLEASLTTTGEAGVSSLEAGAAAMWHEWADAWTTWKESDTAGTSPFHAERLAPEEWRLTTEGVTARKDLRAGELSYVFEFVLKTGDFRNRKPVAGRSRLLKLDRKQSPQKSASTDANEVGFNVSNWGEGAKAIGDLLSGQLEVMLERLVENPKRRRKKTANKKTTVGPDPNQKQREQFEARFYLVYEKYGLAEACRECGLDEVKGTRLRNKLRMRKRREAEKAEKARRVTEKRDA